jgi:superfamily II DNA or RNA helicase
MVKTGIYEQVINKDLTIALENEPNLLSYKSPIDDAEAPKILSDYLASVLQRGLSSSSLEGGLHEQVRIVNDIVKAIVQATGEEALSGLTVDPRAEQLLALIDKRNLVYSINEKAEVPRPETSISQSSLFTGAAHEPSMVIELKREIASSDRIDLLVSFIKWSGLRLLMDELSDFTRRGGKLRVITTSYMGATDVKAVERLSRLPNTEVKISYDTKRTRLHAKTYVFYRDTGFSTAYIGSSNLSNAAISNGLEWNVKVTAQDLPETMRKINATFESYWNSPEFEAFTDKETDRLSRALRAERLKGDSPSVMLFDIAPYPFQQEILDKLAAERILRNSYKNLVVAATGTGKTIISAFDYKRFCNENPGKPNRLLFVAHREEILEQSLSCFQNVLKNQNFGDKYYSGFRPENLDHLFVSIQTFQSQQLDEKTTPDFYDFIIVDEFHHAAAPTYQRLLEYYKPKILLGLTATPERMDGKSVLTYFDDRIAAEVRLPEAIERKLLCPFQYFGVTDTADLNELKWRRGGYDKMELSDLYTVNQLVAERRADLIVRSINRYINDIDEVKGLGFCVSVAHAKFMAEHFNAWKIPSISITADTSDEERSSARKRLVNGDIKFIFTVDIFNEGVDIPEVNTVLFLRPTESLTVFLQQLGRGLRLAENKECLTVLDFIGQANQQYHFEDKFAALLSERAKSVESEIKNDFSSLPKGCYIQLERKAKEIIYNNIRNALCKKAGILSRIASFEENSQLSLTLNNFLSYYHMDIRSLYTNGSFSRLCAQAGVKPDFSEPDEDLLAKALYRICSIDSRLWINFLLDILPKADNQDETQLDASQLLMLQMLQFTIWQKSAKECGFSSTMDGLRHLKQNKTLYAELLEILKYQLDHIDIIDKKNDLDFACPLDLYCTYSRDQALVAMGFTSPNSVTGGVKYISDKKSDLLFVTLNKSDKDYSPTTMYNDYSINEWLFHWQSQSKTSSDSPVGQRYIHHQEMGNHILLFVRESKKDPYGNTAGYTFLGTADYVKHEGDRPMSITWKLHQPTPAKLLKKTNQMTGG